MRVGNWDMWTEGHWLLVGDIHAIDGSKISAVERVPFSTSTGDGIQWFIYLRGEVATGDLLAMLACTNREEQLQVFHAIRNFLVRGEGITKEGARVAP